ncbi:MAG: Protein MtfA [Betaproteobacteria bacterium ADurb.Bin341]|nr:MAG: Protein MtfA [Betaproteobacteria bacterium ADurb.Bin341]
MTLWATARKLFRRLSGERAPQPISDALWQKTVDALPFLSCLSEDEKNRLRHLSELFLAEKRFSAAGGLILDEAMCVAIAAQGCLPILELGLSAYHGWLGIVVYPDEFIVPRRFEDESGVVHEFDDVISGEAWPGGPLIISWNDVRMAGSGYNVVIHEFAHKLDMQNGEDDGGPPLHSGIRREEWEHILLAAYRHFCHRVDSGEETPIDPYASEHPSEFFAVLTESFFERPQVVRSEYPELYELFARYYRQDPARRLTPR